MADHDVSKMKVADLKRELKNRGLNVTGNKTELVERLQAAIIEGDVFDDTGISEELLDDNDDVLNDDELDEETKSYLASTQDEDAMLKSPTESNASKSPDEPPVSEPQQQKKVVLKRKLTTSISLTESEASTGSTTDKVSKIDATDISNGTENGNTDTDSGDKKVVKLSELSIKDRLELRAKKFGVPLPPDAVKLARADRFGVNAASKTAPESSGPITATATASVDVLKKRAERFGGSVSKVMNTIENQEKLQKRQARFGAAAAAAADTPTEEKEVASPAISGGTATTTEYAEKARLRLERFKTAVK